VEHAGLAAAVAKIEESECIGRGSGPAVVKNHLAEVRCVEEDARLPSQAAVDAADCISGGGNNQVGWDGGKERVRTRRRWRGVGDA
jgi:hypothetical protein